LVDAKNREIIAMFLKEPSHILIILLVLVLLFGAKRLPDSARSLAKSLRIFKSEIKDINKDEKKPGDEGGSEK
jgi:sec-independent protein translocase protein TatA